MNDLLSIVGAISLSLGGGAAIVFALSKWLGGVWVGRILEHERAVAAKEQELLIRRRNVYAKLALSMRVFLNSGAPSPNDKKTDFLQAYDEAALWASEEVITEIANFLDLLTKHASNGAVDQQTLKAAFVNCITAMRRDCGFPTSQYQHRVVSFDT